MPQSLEEAYKTIAEEALELFGGKYASVFLKTKTGVRRVYATDSGLYKIKPRPKFGITAKAVKAKKPFVSNADDGNKLLRKFKDIQTVITIPLIFEKKAVGILTILSNKSEQLSHVDIHFLNLYGATASLAIVKSKQFEQLKKAIKTRDMFMSMAAHELKTPLTVIKSYAQLIERNVQNGEMPDAKWSSALIQESGRLADLTNELLELSRIKTGKLRYQLKPLSLTHVIQKAAEDAKLSHPDYPVLFKSNLKGNSDIIKGDFNKLSQMLNNLINNAVKFSPFGSKITIHLKSLNHQCCLSVSDKGSGIPKDQIPKIFAEFYKGNKNKSGMGLGLFLVKNIVDNHGGSIKVSSKTGKGTKFEIYFQTTK